MNIAANVIPALLLCCALGLGANIAFSLPVVVGIICKPNDILSFGWRANLKVVAAAVVIKFVVAVVALVGSSIMVDSGAFGNSNICAMYVLSLWKWLIGAAFFAMGCEFLGAALVGKRNNAVCLLTPSVAFGVIQGVFLSALIRQY